MDLVDLVRIGLRRWYVAVPAGIVVLLASLVVRSSVDLEYKSTGSLLLFAPREAIVAENPLLGFNSLHVPASVTAQVVSSLETRERLIARGASENYEVGLDPSNPAPLVIAVATGGREEARRTVELVLAEVNADLERRQEGLGAPPGTWITTEIVTPPTRPIAQAGARTRAFIAVVMVGSALAAGLTLLADLLLSRRSRTSRRREPDSTATDEPAPEAAVPAPVMPSPPPMPTPTPAGASRPATDGRDATTAAPVPAPSRPPASARGPATSPPAPHPAPTAHSAPAAPRGEPGPAAPAPAAAAQPGAPGTAPIAPAPAPLVTGRPRPAPAYPSGAPPESAPHVPASPAAGQPAPASRPATPAAPPPPPEPATPAASSPPPPPAAAVSPASPPGSHDSGHGAIPVRRRHPYLVAREDEAPTDENGQAPVRKSGTD